MCFCFSDSAYTLQAPSLFHITCHGHIPTSSPSLTSAPTPRLHERQTQLKVILATGRILNTLLHPHLHPRHHLGPRHLPVSLRGLTSASLSSLVSPHPLPCTLRSIRSHILHFIECTTPIPASGPLHMPFALSALLFLCSSPEEVRKDSYSDLSTNVTYLVRVPMTPQANHLPVCPILH